MLIQFKNSIKCYVKLYEIVDNLLFLYKCYFFVFIFKNMFIVDCNEVIKEFILKVIL